MPLAALRLALAIAYPLLAHWASEADSGAIAALALADLAVIVLLQPLAARRGWAWALLALVLAGLVALARSAYAQLPLLAPPMVFTAVLAWWFGRSLRPHRVAVITKIVAGLDRTTPERLPPRLLRYTRRLTAAWAGLLAGLSLANGVLALVAVPGGVLARLGHPPAWSIGQAQWSLFANLLDYGIVGGFFLGEYVIRRRLFPDRPYRNLAEFLQRLAGLGPKFWRELFT